MAAQDSPLTPAAAPRVLYLNGLPLNGLLSGQKVVAQATHHTLYQLQLNPDNPNQAALLPAPGREETLAANYRDALQPAYQTLSPPQAGEKFIDIQKPTLVERVGSNWRITDRGQVRFSALPVPALTVYGAPTLPAREQAAPPSPAEALAGEVARPGSNLSPGGGGELHISWQQKGAEVAPLLEMRACLDQLKDAGVAVGALRLERDAQGKLAGGFGVSYNPESGKLGQLEATLQGLRQVGHGLTVAEQPAQAAARRQQVGFDDDYEPQRSKQVRAAFGASQWDALSANLAAVPRQGLSAPEQVQQAAAEQRVQQIAQQQGKISQQVVQEGKRLFDIDTSGNPATVFLKNFYAHLTGGPRLRQHVEADYEATRQALQSRLTGGAAPAGPPAQTAQPAQTIQPAAQTAQPAALAAASAAAPAFEPRDVPPKVLAALGVKPADLERSGQLARLLSGQPTDLLALQVAGRNGQPPVRFEGKLVLQREAGGAATLKVELPREKLVIPGEVGGQPLTPEQRRRLETEGSAGLMRGLRDEQGRPYNGYVAVDQTMNRVVVLPERKVSFQDTIAGVRLSPEQSHDLREGKAVALANMVSADGGRKFDGTAQVNAAKASIEIKPARHERQQRQAPPLAPESLRAAGPPAPAAGKAPRAEAPKPLLPPPSRGPRP